MITYVSPLFTLFLFSMSTRSRIALQLTEDSFVSVYHHWDGYPSWLGVTLKKKFNTREKIAELIDGGDLSSCDSDTDWNMEKLDESRPLYYNDRGEKTEPALHLNIDDLFAVDCGQEYTYIYTLDHEWECYEVERLRDDDFKIVDTKIQSVPIPEKYPVH